MRFGQRGVGRFHRGRKAVGKRTWPVFRGDVGSEKREYRAGLPVVFQGDSGEDEQLAGYKRLAESVARHTEDSEGKEMLLKIFVYQFEIGLDHVHTI